jgi:hypothetical protein
MKLLQKTITCFLMLLLTTTFVNCTKEDKTPDPSVEIVALLSAKLWKISSTVMITTNGNLNQAIPSCRLDNLWEYNSSRQFFLYPGVNKCSTSELTQTGNWELVSDNKSLKITLANGSSYTDEIVLLDATKLQLKYVIGTSVYVDTYIPN